MCFDHCALKPSALSFARCSLLRSFNHLTKPGVCGVGERRIRKHPRYQALPPVEWLRIHHPAASRFVRQVRVKSCKKRRT